MWLIHSLYHETLKELVEISKKKNKLIISQSQAQGNKAGYNIEHIDSWVSRH